MEEAFSQLVDGLAARDWAVSDGLFGPDLSADLLHRAEELYTSGQMKVAGVGKQKQEEEAIRATSIRWLDPDALVPVEQLLWAQLDALRLYLNRTCFLSLASFECHFAVYPTGAYYRRHLDQFQSDNARLVSFILYLNRDWTPEDGGALRLFFSHENGERHEDVLPEMGRFAMFRSDLLEHEVMTTMRQRVGVVGWMKTHAGRVL
jgi:SM-20-related protein